jgi:peptide-methionine (R)-S-oxide reductase
MNAKLISSLLFGTLVFGTSYCQTKSRHDESQPKNYEISKSESEWKEILSDEQYNVLREKGTEYAFTGEYNDFKKKGVFICAACNNELFDSKTKYNSGSGWPSFYKPIDKGAVEEIVDDTLGIKRIEVVCARCGGHLGHVFDDGPQPTGLRYCVNSVSMSFVEKE